MKLRLSRTNVAHMALSQTGLANPAATITIAAESQVATANELSRKST